MDIILSPEEQNIKDALVNYICENKSKFSYNERLFQKYIDDIKNIGKIWDMFFDIARDDPKNHYLICNNLEKYIEDGKFNFVEKGDIAPTIYEYYLQRLLIRIDDKIYKNGKKGFCKTWVNKKTGNSGTTKLDLAKVVEEFVGTNSRASFYPDNANISASDLTATHSMLNRCREKRNNIRGVHATWKHAPHEIMPNFIESFFVSTIDFKYIQNIAAGFSINVKTGECDINVFKGDEFIFKRTNVNGSVKIPIEKKYFGDEMMVEVKVKISAKGYPNQDKTYTIYRGVFSSDPIYIYLNKETEKKESKKEPGNSQENKEQKNNKPENVPHKQEVKNQSSAVADNKSKEAPKGNSNSQSSTNHIIIPPNQPKSEDKPPVKKGGETSVGGVTPIPIIPTIDDKNNNSTNNWPPLVIVPAPADEQPLPAGKPQPQKPHEIPVKEKVISDDELQKRIRGECDDYDCFHDGLARVWKSGKAGYIDKTGKLVILTECDRAGYFREGLARVRKSWKWGFIDKTGNFVIPCEWDSASVFSEDLARVSKSGKYGFIDKTGNLVIPCEWDDAHDFCKGVARVSRSEDDFYINKKGKVQLFRTIAHNIIENRYLYLWCIVILCCFVYLVYGFLSMDGGVWFVVGFVIACLIIYGIIWYKVHH